MRYAGRKSHRPAGVRQALGTEVMNWGAGRWQIKVMPLLTLDSKQQANGAVMGRALNDKRKHLVGYLAARLALSVRARRQSPGSIADVECGLR